ncbi:MAG: hypothetical protein ABIE94_02275 [archaeon]
MVKLDDELYKLPPEERIRKIKELEEKRKKELQELKKHEEETEREIKRSIEDSILEDELERREEEEDSRKKKDAEEGAPLEQTVREEEPPPPEATGQSEYKIPGTEGEGPLGLYQVAGDEARGEIYRLRDKNVWDSNDAARYQQIKDGFESAKNTVKYESAARQVVDGLDATYNALKSLGQTKHDYQP